MRFSITAPLVSSAMAALVAGSPVLEKESDTVCILSNLSIKRHYNIILFQLAKREVSYGNPDLATDQGGRFKLDFGSTEGHPNACPGHFICCEKYCTQL